MHNIIVDAAYEWMQKRTFLGVMIMAALHLPFLLGIIVSYVYQKLKYSQPYSKYSKVNGKEEHIIDESDSE